MTTPAITLFGHPDSGHACKVALALKLAGIDHETRFIDIWAARETRPEDFLAASPLGEVPLLMVGDQAMTQSGAILLHLAERFKVLGGESAEGLQRARTLMMWEGNRIGMCLPQLKEAYREGSGGLPADVIAWLSARFEIDRANFGALLGDAPFFHGDTPGIGDCAIWGYVQWVKEARMIPSAAMDAWSDRMRALPVDTTPASLFPRA